MDNRIYLKDSKWANSSNKIKINHPWWGKQLSFSSRHFHCDGNNTHYITFPNSGALVPRTNKENPRELTCTDPVSIVWETMEKTIFIVEIIFITLPLGHSPFSPTSANPSAVSCWCGSCMPYHSPGLWRAVLSLSCFKDTVFWQVSAAITDMISCSLENLLATYFLRKHIGPSLEFPRNLIWSHMVSDICTFLKLLKKVMSDKANS